MRHPSVMKPVRVKVPKMRFPALHVMWWRFRIMTGKATYPSPGLLVRVHIGRCSHDTAVQLRLDFWRGYFFALVFATRRLTLSGAP